MYVLRGISISLPKLAQSSHIEIATQIVKMLVHCSNKYFEIVIEIVVKIVLEIVIQKQIYECISHQQLCRSEQKLTLEHALVFTQIAMERLCTVVLATLRWKKKGCILVFGVHFVFNDRNASSKYSHPYYFQKS